MATTNEFSGIRVILLLVTFLTIVGLSFGGQIYCGSKLREVVDLMCPNGLNGYKTKRVSFSLDEDFSSEIMEEDDDFNLGFSLDMLTDMEDSGIAKLRRRRHGIVNECCNKPCSTSEVLSYCKN